MGREGGRERNGSEIEWREGHEGPLTTRYIPASARACGIDHLRGKQHKLVI